MFDYTIAPHHNCSAIFIRAKEIKKIPCEKICQLFKFKTYYEIALLSPNEQAKNEIHSTANEFIECSKKHRIFVKKSKNIE